SDRYESSEFRIKILQYLKEIDKGNTSIYIEEIENLEKERIIEERVKNITISKISVDTEKIYEKLKNIFKENYNKLLETLEFPETMIGIDVQDDVFSKKLNESIDKINQVFNNYS